MTLTYNQCDRVMRVHPYVQARYIGTPQMTRFDEVYNQCIDFFLVSLSAPGYGLGRGASARRNSDKAATPSSSAGVREQPRYETSSAHADDIVSTGTSGGESDYGESSSASVATRRNKRSTRHRSSS